MEKTNSKAGMWIAFIVIAFLSYKCVFPSTETQEVPQVEYKNPIDSIAISLVRKTQTEKKGSQFVTAPLHGGVAVIADGHAGYWVNNKIVYATNGIAKNWSPGIEYSPPEIDQMKIISTIESYQETKIIR